MNAQIARAVRMIRRVGCNAVIGGAMALGMSTALMSCVEESSSQQSGLGPAEGDPSDPAYAVGNDQRMVDAIAEAKRTLPTFIDALKQAQGRDRYFSVKRPFATSDGGSEHIWIDELKWMGTSFQGRVANVPASVPGLTSGETVSVAVEEVSDWMIVDAGGRLTGGFTIRAMREMMSPEQRTEFDASSGLVID